jgi:hypothetical protein
LYDDALGLGLYRLATLKELGFPLLSEKTLILLVNGIVFIELALAIIERCGDVLVRSSYLQSFVALRYGQSRESIDQEFKHSRQAREMEED